MTQRLRPMARTRRQTFFHSEDRQTFLVSIAFVVIIVLLVTLLVGAVAVGYYNDNLRPVARIGDVELGPGIVRERGALLGNRITLEQNRLTSAIISREIDETRGSQRRAELDQRRGELGILAVEGLIDTIYQSQLAADEGISVSEAEVDQRMTQELTTHEKRHVLAIVVEPEAEDAQEEPSLRDRHLARDRAQEALAEIEAGREWAEVARDHSTHDSAANGGDLGWVSSLAPEDPEWSDALFELEAGETTDVMLDREGNYRFGRVLEIQPGTEEPGARANLLQGLSEERYREFLRYEIAAEKLQNQILAETLATPVDQVNVAAIFIDASTDTGDEDAEQGEIRYSEIVYAPNDDIENAPELAADDPAWEEARTQAQAAFDELAAIEDQEARAERFAEIAVERSDSPTTGEVGGDAGFLTRGLVPEAYGVALWDEEHDPGELIGPVRSDAGYVVLLFHERREVRPPASERLQRVKDLLAQPGADFTEIAREHSDDESSTEEGGELGWFTRDMLDITVGEEIFSLETGDVSEEIELGNGYYIFKALERTERPLDVDQRSEARRQFLFGQPLEWSAAFERWYAPKKDAAEEAQIITRADDEPEDLEPGFEDDPGFDEDFDPDALDPAELEPDFEEQPDDELEEAEE